MDRILFEEQGSEQPWNGVLRRSRGTGSRVIQVRSDNGRYVEAYPASLHRDAQCLMTIVSTGESLHVSRMISLVASRGLLDYRAHRDCPLDLFFVHAFYSRFTLTPYTRQRAQKFTPCSSIAQRLHSIGSTVETFVRGLLLRTTPTPFETRLFCLLSHRSQADRLTTIHHVKAMHAKMIRNCAAKEIG